MEESMLSVLEAKKKIIFELKQVETIKIQLENAGDMILAQSLIASMDSPSFSNSSMDGFAVIANNVSSATSTNPIKLKIVGEVPAGIRPEKILSNGESMRVMTGAMIPDGADAVIPVEKTDLDFSTSNDLNNTFVNILDKVLPGDYIRKKGEDFEIGTKLLEIGRPLRAQDLSILAMMGIGKPEVFRKPKIAIFSSGDELIPVSDKIIVGKIRETNSYALGALIESCGSEVINLGIAKDNEIEIKNLLEEAVFQKVDMIISTAGVSVGVYDYVRKVIIENGSINFWKVNMRPGKPLVFGKYQNIPFFGLPGNPVSSFVGFEVFVRDAINYMRGAFLGVRKRLSAKVTDDIYSDGRESYLRAIVTFDGTENMATLAGHQGSGNIYSLVKANSLLIVPASVKFVPAGGILEYWDLSI